MKHKIIFTLLVLCSNIYLFSQKKFTKEDSLRGSNHAFRVWSDVINYDISITPNTSNKSIVGCNIMRYRVLTDTLPFVLQVDLQSPMKIDSMIMLSDTQKHKLTFTNENNRWLVSLPKSQKDSVYDLCLYFSGKPTIAKHAPWEGGWVWAKDSLERPWATVACQDIGASVWFPCKDIQSDEATATLHILVPNSVVGVGNGTLTLDTLGTLQRYNWTVKNVINSYNIVPYIGNYVLIHDSVQGESGNLITDYWVLDYHKDKVQSHLKPNVTKMLKCFEYWFGPYPFYNDSYKIVEAPHLGMEHQSNIAYGNHFLNGYLGRDLSGTDWGMKWDFIVVHESGHEWFGNNVTAKDVADNWIHESFTSYSEVLFTECEFGKEAGSDYCIGVRRSILNDAPIIGTYNVREEGSGDMYYKGSQIINMIRHIINNDEKFRALLKAINKTYYHKTVSSEELEQFISQYINVDLKSFFSQYLRTTQIPRFEYKMMQNKLEFRFSNCINSFTMPLKIMADKEYILKPTTQWQSIKLDKAAKKITIDRNMYVDISNN